MQFKNTIQAMQKLGSNVVKEGRSILKKKNKQTKQNTLYNDFDYLVTASDSSVTLEFEFGGAEDYWAFVDEGVRGAGGFKGSGKMRGQGSPFKFSTKMPPRQPLINWIKNKPIKGRDKKGRFISNESLGFLIQRAIYQRGLQRTQFFSKPFTDELKKETDKIVKSFADDLELAIETIIK
tara:strand:- start:1057 stop:1593 length:537 start_codon:yes stop_codon:yes gene_type:complete